MNGRAAEAAVLTAVALVITAAIAAPVLGAPSERLFGMAAVGHHHDPFTFMQRIERPIAVDAYLQPATDLPGAVVTLASGPVAAYNWIVLITFPLSALAAFLLARHLAIAPLWAGVAALLFAFSPFHLAHAAYHPHIAQTQWIPFYLLALWQCLKRPSSLAMTALALAVAAVTLSNFYGGLIAAVMTVPAAAAYWFFMIRPAGRDVRGPVMTGACLAGIAAAGGAYAWSIARGLATGPAHVVDPTDLIRYGARWWSYLVPPVAHPLAGSAVRDLWHAAGVDVGLLEQQVALGWGAIALAGIAAAATARRPIGGAAHAAVPLLVVVAAIAFLFSLGGGLSGLLHQLLPGFRSYARFAVIVQLMVALLAAIGAERLWRSGRRYARAMCVVLLALVGVEYVVWPPMMSRPVLPTRAHYWVAQRESRVRVLDCAPRAGDTAAIQWLTRYQVTPYGEPFLDCGEPNLAEKLAAAGYTHVLVRHETPEARRLGGRRVAEGLQAAAHFDDSVLFAVAALPPAVHTVSMANFHAREHDRTWTWRWMEDRASWTISNRRPERLTARVEIEMMAFASARELIVLLDGEQRQSIMVGVDRSVVRLEPFLLTPGDHQLTFRAGRSRPPHTSSADETDPRPLSFAIGGWRWVAREAHHDDD